MSLVNLLAMGRSVTPAKESPGRYRLGQQNLLPRFGTEDPAALPVAEPVRAGEPAAMGGARAVRRAGFWRRLFRGKARREEGSWVQGELTLDAVKVVRNDLTEADFEIIPGRSERTWSRLTDRLFHNPEMRKRG